MKHTRGLCSSAIARTNLVSKYATFGSPKLESDDASTIIDQFRHPLKDPGAVSTCGGSSARIWSASREVRFKSNALQM